MNEPKHKLGEKVLIHAQIVGRRESLRMDNSVVYAILLGKEREGFQIGVSVEEEDILSGVGLSTEEIVANAKTKRAALDIGEILRSLEGAVNGDKVAELEERESFLESEVARLNNFAISQTKTINSNTIEIANLERWNQNQKEMIEEDRVRINTLEQQLPAQVHISHEYTSLLKQCSNQAETIDSLEDEKEKLLAQQRESSAIKLKIFDTLNQVQNQLRSAEYASDNWKDIAVCLFNTAKLGCHYATQGGRKSGFVLCKECVYLNVEGGQRCGALPANTYRRVEEKIRK